ncbi:MAG: RHS repeat-associated core domain-containing protein [Actinomycetota bacterium]
MTGGLGGSVETTYDDLDRIASRNSEAFGYNGGSIDPVAIGDDTYGRTPGGNLLSTNENTAAVAVRDRHGDVVATINTNGTIASTTAYDPFGEPIHTSGDTPALGFQADYTDPTTGDVWMGARWYDPTNAQFRSRDTIFGELQTPISLNRYTYAWGNPLNMWDPLMWSYGYDEASRLTSWSHDARSHQVGWDANGNRVFHDSDVASYDARNRIVTSPDGTHVWEPRGTLDRVDGPAGADYTFDDLGRLTAVTGGAGGTVDIDYDGLDRIASRNNQAFGYNGAAIDPVSIGDDTYGRTPGGNLLSTNEDAASVAVRDRHGDVVATLSTDGSVVSTTAYDPFGEPLHTSGDTPALGFQADYTDPVTGDVWMGARWYDPTNAQFRSRDTVFGELSTPISLNRYTYAFANPIRYWDPDGRCSQFTAWEGGGGTCSFYGSDWSVELGVNEHGDITDCAATGNAGPGGAESCNNQHERSLESSEVYLARAEVESLANELYEIALLDGPQAALDHFSVLWEQEKANSEVLAELLRMSVEPPVPYRSVDFTSVFQAPFELSYTRLTPGISFRSIVNWEAVSERAAWLDANQAIANFNAAAEAAAAANDAAAATAGGRAVALRIGGRLFMLVDGTLTAIDTVGAVDDALTATEGASAGTRYSEVANAVSDTAGRGAFAGFTASAGASLGPCSATTVWYVVCVGGAGAGGWVIYGPLDSHVVEPANRAIGEGFDWLTDRLADADGALRDWGTPSP